MTAAEVRLYSRLALRLAPRFRWRIWRNFLRYYRIAATFDRRSCDELPYNPPNVIVWVTNRCNKDCNFCQYLVELNAKNHRELELTFDRFKQLLDMPIARDCLRLGLYGGEPLLNQDLPEMIAYGKSRGHLVTLNTNGLLIKKRRAALLDCPPDLLIISYYPEDRERTREAIALTAPHMPVAINYMYSEARLGDVEEVVKCAVECGAWVVRLNTYEVQGERADCALPSAAEGAAKVTLSVSASRPQEAKILADDPRLMRLQRELDAKYGRRVLISWPRAPRPESPVGPARCRTFWQSTWLDAKGQMSPCCVWPIAGFEGNLWEGTASWNSQRMIHLRQGMRRNVYTPICSTCTHLYGDQLGV